MQVAFRYASAPLWHSTDFESRTQAGQNAGAELEKHCLAPSSVHAASSNKTPGTHTKHMAGGADDRGSGHDPSAGAHTRHAGSASDPQHCWPLPQVNQGPQGA